MYIQNKTLKLLSSLTLLVPSAPSGLLGRPVSFNLLFLPSSSNTYEKATTLL